MALEERAVELLRQLIRHRTVNPPGNERALQEELAVLFGDAGFEVELRGRTPERPNLVARLRGAADGPVLTSTPSWPIQPSGSAIRGRATWSTARSGAAAPRT